MVILFAFFNVSVKYSRVCTDAAIFDAYGLSSLTWAEIEEIMNNPNNPRHIEVFGSLTNRP